MTLFIPRFLLGVVTLMCMLLIMKCFLIGHRKDKPIKKGCRKNVIRLTFNLTARILLTSVFWTWSKYEYVDADYSKYLGCEDDGETGTKSKKADEDKNKPISTVICNHVGFHEILALLRSPIFPSFTPKEALKNSWLVGPACYGLQSLFMPRIREGVN